MPQWTRTLFPLDGWPVPIVVVITQFAASLMVNFLSYSKLSAIYPLFKIRTLERNGEIYQELFNVKSWKEHIPSIGAFDKKTLTKKKLTTEYVSQYLLEGLRAELCHLISIILSMAVLLVSIPKTWSFILGYSALLNLPCIIIQRYNRPRFERILAAKNENGQIDFTVFWIKDDGKAYTSREEKRMRRKARHS